MDRPTKVKEFLEDYDRKMLGFQQSALFKAMGYTSDQIKKSRIAIVNSWSEQSPGHFHLRELSKAITLGVTAAGATAFEINVLGPCSSFAGNTDDLVHYDMPQRETICNSIETGLRVGWCDGWVGLATCDKIVPAMLMAALRLNRPCLIVLGGSMIPGHYQGEWVALGRGGNIFAENQAIDPEAFEELTSACGTCSGACSEMTTGSTMMVMTEALGMGLPYSSTVPAAMAEIKQRAYQAGEQIVKLVKNNIRPSDIITEKSIENAIKVDMAVCGATNSVLHLQALAHETKLKITLDTWDRISQKTPVLCNVAPSGPYSVCDLHWAGGIPAVMKEISDLLHLDVLTCTGKTLAENIAKAKITNHEVILSKNQPLYKEGAIAILKGNLAPIGAIIRHTIVTNRALLDYEFTAKVFDSYLDALEAILTGNPKRIEPGDIVVCRYEGPRGGPAMGEMFFLTDALKKAALKDVAVITDGRFSGFTRSVVAIGYVAPEAYVGGPLALVQDYDKIQLDVAARQLNLNVSEEELARRKAAWLPPAQNFKKGVLAIYRDKALQADQGAGWPIG